ncbi:MAG: acyl-CoA dehydrogenase family protein [Gammaproteobacteria bacterium]
MTESITSFQQATRQWLEAHCPASMRTPLGPNEEVWGGRNATFHSEDARIWLEKMAGKGWTTPRWPSEYGGGGLTQEQNLCLQSELARIRARPALQSFGIWMLGPVLLEYANEQQKTAHLPHIVQGKIRWCQGYSEPGSGSDLASLSTRAEDRGDHYLVNGQKVWTSYADKADWIFCLVRTGPQEPKHEGISFLLIDMKTTGISTKPITLISGASPFCETFFDNVKVPKENLVGNLNHGWEIAKKLLQHERNMISGMGTASGGKSTALEEIARNYRGGVLPGSNSPEIADPILRNKVSTHKMNGHAFMLTLQRAQQEGGKANHLSSLFKYFGTELNKDRYELMLECMGQQALGWDPSTGFTDQERNVTKEWLRSKANSIEGGTSEVQLNVIAKRVLNLPSS